MSKLLIFIGLLFSFSCNSEEVVYLYVMFHDDNTTGERFRTRMDSMKECYATVENAKLKMPVNASGDYEVMAAMWCGKEFQRNYNATWFKDELRDLNKEK